jgi:hypothetical protein
VSREMNEFEKDDRRTKLLAWGACALIGALFLFILWLTSGCAPVPGPQPPATPTATSAPTPTATSAPYSPLPPKITMRTSGEAATGGRIDITEHFVVDPDPRVLDEMPTRDDSLFWRGCDHEGHCGTLNCDSDHWTYPENAGDLAGQPTVNWWNCGGSVKFSTQPRKFDLSGPFTVSHSGGVSVIYGRTKCEDGGGCTTTPGCFRNDWFNLCYSGQGTVTVCVPLGAHTADGVMLRVSERCGTWPVQ